eukprot:TRINITY_DN1462_c0_g1_i1.p1 TRINITY_DN1462_c0_g1~~TRINITY_DN1462_c0_g1_i1.p1  ORF type:complete len:441 (+),score=141.37 TRINITY_DN1462_c0_g1_i1:118-1440(+)
MSSVFSSGHSNNEKGEGHNVQDPAHNKLPANGESTKDIEKLNLSERQEALQATVHKMEETFHHEIYSEDAAGEKEDIEFDPEDTYELEPVTDLELYEKQMKLPPSIASPSHASIITVRRMLLLYNPASGAQQGAKIAKKVEELLRKKNVDVISIKLEKRGHAEEIIKDYNFKGIDVVGVLGGDGTFHESINGLMKRNEEDRRVPIAFIPGGTGNSFALELQGGTKVERAVKHILRGLNCPIDIGEVTFPREDGTEEKTFSFNSIHWGLASRVNVTAEKLRWVGKAIRYTTAAFLEMIRGETTPAKITLETADGKVEVYEEEFCLVIVNNIISAAKGMKMAPFAKLNDGLFDILLIRSNKTLDLMGVFRKVYDGSHILSKDVEYRQVRSFSIVPYKKENPKELMDEKNPQIAEELVDIDGELKGSTPFMCKVLPRAARVIV